MLPQPGEPHRSCQINFKTGDLYYPKNMQFSDYVAVRFLFKKGKSHTFLQMKKQLHHNKQPNTVFVTIRHLVNKPIPISVWQPFHIIRCSVTPENEHMKLQNKCLCTCGHICIYIVLYIYFSIHANIFNHSNCHYHLYHH